MRYAHVAVTFLLIGLLVRDILPCHGQSTSGLAPARRDGKVPDRIGDRPQPIYERRFSPAQRRQVDSLTAGILQAENADDHERVLVLYRQLMALNSEALGEDHHDTEKIKVLFEANKLLGSMPAALRAEWRELRDKAQQFEALNQAAKYAESAGHLRRYVDFCARHFGRRHPFVATNLSTLAMTITPMSQLLEAEEYCLEAIDILNEWNMKKQPDYANVLSTLATCYYAQGKLAESQQRFQEAVDLELEILGPRHIDVAAGYNNLASLLVKRGKYAQAEPLFVRALEVSRAIVGDKHPQVATQYGNLAATLAEQGKHVDAQRLLARSIDIRLGLTGPDHPSLIRSYSNLAATLDAQQRFAEAAEYHTKALSLAEKYLRDDQADRLQVKKALALNLYLQNKFIEAEEAYEALLAAQRKLFGDQHPEVASGSLGLASVKMATGAYDEAEQLHLQALAIVTKVYGDKHPQSLAVLNSLGANLHAAGKHEEAIAILQRAATSYESARMEVGRRGLDRAAFGEASSPYKYLAITLAQCGRAREAWEAAEADLARGLADQLVLQRASSRTDGAPTRRNGVASLQDIQTAIPKNAALILWVDFSAMEARRQEHWGCVVRSDGDPNWVKLPGSGPDGKWTARDNTLPQDLREAIAASAGNDRAFAPLAESIYAQRLAPLLKYLDGIDNLYAVAVRSMAGVPLEVLTSQYTVSYVPPCWRSVTHCFRHRNRRIRRWWKRHKLAIHRRMG
jgi:tetratricopeptide (TPR) repeat protein